ncbi:Transposon Ty3-G Gag-Pol polyprotein, partial [Araneus ventricosus]
NNQRIVLNSDLPVSLRPYRTSPVEEQEIKSQVEKLLQAGLIKESNSPYSSPVTLAFKRDEGKKTRLCIDFRKLNALCKSDSEPLPLMDSLLDKLSKAKIFSSLDLASGYWHVPIHPKDTEKLAFCTNFGLYEWCRLPFGIKVAPAIFNRLIRRILTKYKIDFACNYFDDIIVYSSSELEHWKHLKTIFEICEKENIKLKLSKCVFAQTKISFLGYEIEQDNNQRIVLNSDLPVSLRPYRTSPVEEQEIKSQVEKLLQAGLIKESNSPYSSPVTLAFKRDEGKKTRLCIDFRKLNALCKSDSEPLPLMDSLLDKLSKAKIFSSLDLASGYWHVPIHPKDTEKLAFCTNFGLYEWCRLPFGIKVAPAIFNRLIRRILTKYKIDFACNYFDDIIVYSSSELEHWKHLKTIFEICEKENIKLKLSKCVFAQTKISFLGYEIEQGKVSPNNANIFPPSARVVRQQGPCYRKTCEVGQVTFKILLKF